MHYSHSKTLKLLKKYKSLLLLSFGLFLLAFGGINYYRIRILSFNISPSSHNSPEEGKIPKHIRIPSINIDIPIEKGQIKDNIWKISYDKATFLLSSSVPNENGNVVIYGHNKTKIFGNLPYLSLGQKIFIVNNDNQEFEYEIYKKDFVGPERIDLVSPTNQEELTLFTCWGIFDQERAVVKAKLIKGT